MAKKAVDTRKYMEMAIDAMQQSIQEPRNDKTSPKVGAILLKANGKFDTGSRGELRDGDHAEFIVIERKNASENLEGALLFTTLEPSAPGQRKNNQPGSAELIVNARISQVWVGVEDPDPMADLKGINYLLDNGVDVHMFDADLQAEIWDANKAFQSEAEERAKRVRDDDPENLLSIKEKAEKKASLDDLSEPDVNWFLDTAGLDAPYGSKTFLRTFMKLGLLADTGNGIAPTGIGILLFGTEPQLIYHNAVIRATLQVNGREEIETFDGPLIRQPEKLISWFEQHIGHQINREQAQRERKYDFPLLVFREALINAIVHRDYDIEGAPIYFTITDDEITIKSPGEPVPPLTLDDIRTLNAPSLSRNPKIMYIFDQLRLVEQRGLGFQTIKELPEKYDLPLPQITYEAPYICLKFPRSIDAITGPEGTDLNAEELKGLDWIRLNGPVSKKAYAEQFGFNEKKAQRQLVSLKEAGVITQRGGGRSIKYHYSGH